MVNKEKYENSRWIMASYGCQAMFSQWITSAFGLYTIVFYETIVGLDQTLALIAFLIFSAWNAINDPLVGYIMEKFPTRWTKKTGYKRFPIVMITAIPWLFTYFLIFMVPYSWDPVVDQLKIFLWYVLSLCLYDLLYTIMDINANSLYPEKFRNLNERRTSQGFGTILGIIGVVLAFLITGLVFPKSMVGLARSTKFGYYQQAGTISLIGGIFLFLFQIPGLFENKNMRERNLAYLTEVHDEVKTPFWTTVKAILSNKAFMFRIIFFFGYQSAVAIVNASVLYVTIFLLDRQGASIFLSVSMLIGALITTPLWVIISNRVNNNKLMCIVYGIIVFISFIPMMFAQTLLGWIICLFIFGVGVGGSTNNPPTMGDILDDAVIRTGKREPSIYYGFQTFFIRFSEGLKAAVILIVHILTGFDEGNATFTDLAASFGSNIEGLKIALFGIRIHAALIPAILVLVCLILFWIYYPLTPKKVAENKAKLLASGK
jgi:GPH family glycoside/pentoside/hexuronide:cation symporter